MLTKLSVQNLRSIEKCDVELAPITIFFGRSEERRVGKECRL